MTINGNVCLGFAKISGFGGALFGPAVYILLVKNWHFLGPDGLGVFGGWGIAAGVISIIVSLLCGVVGYHGAKSSFVGNSGLCSLLNLTSRAAPMGFVVWFCFSVGIALVAFARGDFNTLTMFVSIIHSFLLALFFGVGGALLFSLYLAGYTYWRGELPKGRPIWGHLPLMAIGIAVGISQAWYWDLSLYYGLFSGFFFPYVLMVITEDGWIRDNHSRRFGHSP